MARALPTGRSVPCPRAFGFDLPRPGLSRLLPSLLLASALAPTSLLLAAQAWATGQAPSGRPASGTPAVRPLWLPRDSGAAVPPQWSGRPFAFPVAPIWGAPNPKPTETAPNWRPY